MNYPSKVKVAGLAETYGRQVFHSAFRLLSDAHLAEDVTQEVFLKLISKSAKTLDKITHWPAYLKSMAVSAAIDQLRRTKRLAEEPLEFAPEHSSEHSQSPLSQVLQQRDLASFRVALTQLKPKDAQAFCLRHVEGYSYQEIADLMNISNSLVGVTLHRAQKKLATRLGGSNFLGE